MITTCVIGAGLLAMAAFVSVEQKTFAAPPPGDPAYTAHSAHVAPDANQTGGQTVETQLAEIVARLEQLEANTQQQPRQSSPSGAMPMAAGNPPLSKQMPGMGLDPALADQMAELRGKMQRLEMTMQHQPGSSAGGMPMGGQPGMGAGTRPMPGKMSGMSGMGGGNPSSGAAPGAMKPAGGMVGGAPAAGGGMGMMGMKMDKMMGMMAKMMGGMGGGAKPAAAPMGGAEAGAGMGMMDMDGKMEMGGMGGGAMPAGAAPAPGMGGGGGMGMMAMDKMEMAGMMGSMGGKGGSSMAMPSALPGFPGASHLYHIGATGFFLDHPQHISLSTEQQMTLNQIKEQATLDKSSADRNVLEAEQALWALTAADQPDNAQIEAKIAEIEKLKGDERLRFIGAVGGAAKVLNEEQRKILAGFAPPAPAVPAAAPMAGGM